ncbi:MAG: hypothetical protein JWN38_1032 [Candidatus Saccharibacteria bacterium]|nr:hypothetical protein [Candidatus Saccharibacteria bacterium]
MAKPAEPQPIADVASPKSKQILVTSRPILHEPQATPDPAAGRTISVTDDLPPSAGKINLQPLMDRVTATAQEAAEAKSRTPQSDEVASAEPVAEPEPSPEPAAPTEPKKPEPPKPAEPAADEPEEPAPETPKGDDQLTPGEEDKAAVSNDEHEIAIAKLIESQQYFLPINTMEKRKARRFIALGVVLILLLGVGWTDIALDAGIITINGVQAPVKVFSK